MGMTGSPVRISRDTREAIRRVFPSMSVSKSVDCLMAGYRLLDESKRNKAIAQAMNEKPKRK